ncbi:MAG TPA: M48 family metallopeptidase, partial [Rhizobiales bacterium]|nr:M48 family metallopeptidase [Hyphomicrobiales bacterium]
MAVQASYFDGQTASNHTVSVDATLTAVRVSGPTIKDFIWSYNDLKAVEKAQSGKPLRLTSSQMPGARLIIPGGQISQRICELSPHLLGGFHPQKALKTVGWITATILLVGGVLYGTLNLAPKTFAGMIPLQWRENLGRQTEKKVIGHARQCTNPDGQRALLKMAAKVASGSENPPDFSVRVFDMKLMNAFAVSGGRVVLTRGLLKAADNPAELAGVFAHELGHVDHHHPEAALVRVMGLQLLITIVSGGGDGNTIGSLAGFATMMSYSRDAEREADRFAGKVLTKTRIDPVGLIHFFEKVKKLEG